MELFLNWALLHKIELGGTAFGLIYIWFSIRQSLYTWPAGIISSLLYVGVFFEAKIYAAMVLQIYYVLISGYGWWSWTHGEQSGSGKDELRVSRTKPTLWIRLFLINMILSIAIYYLLERNTDSPVPFGDAITSSFGIIATWMLARKKLENWIIWIFSDLISVSLFLYRELYPTVLLFAVYTVMAVIGFYEWRKDSLNVSCQKKEALAGS